MTNIKQLSEKLAEEYVNSESIHLDHEIGSKQCFLAGFQSCLDLLAKQSGEYREFGIVPSPFGEKPQWYIVNCEGSPTGKYSHQNIHVVEFAALLSANARIVSLEDKLFCQIKNVQELDEENRKYRYQFGQAVKIEAQIQNAELQKRVKELTEDLETHKSQNLARLGIENTLKEAVEVDRDKWRDRALTDWAATNNDRLTTENEKLKADLERMVKMYGTKIKRKCQHDDPSWCNEHCDDFGYLAREIGRKWGIEL